LSILGIIAIVYVTYIATLAYSISHLDKSYVINGAAMSPTLTNGQKVLVANFDVLNNNLLNTSVSINDLVLVKISLQGQNQNIISRVVAVGGDRVVIQNGVLTVYDRNHPNGFDPSSSYEPSGVSTPGNANLVVPSNDVYILGDNRMVAVDSRILGPIPLTDIIGKVIGVVSKN
jgi:signal peptidase I